MCATFALFKDYCVIYLHCTEISGFWYISDIQDIFLTIWVFLFNPEYILSRTLFYVIAKKKKNWLFMIFPVVFRHSLKRLDSINLIRSGISLPPRCDDFANKRLFAYNYVQTEICLTSHKRKIYCISFISLFIEFLYM